MKVGKSIISITTQGVTTETFVLESMVYMQSKGWDVTLMCKTTPHLLERVPQGMKCVDVPFEHNFSIPAVVKCTWQLVKYFRKTRPTIVQYATSHAQLCGSIAAWLTRVPVRICLQWGVYNYGEMGMSGHFYKFLEKMFCTLSTDVRPVSHKNLQVAISEGLFKEGKGKVLGQGGTIGVDLTQYPLKDKTVLRKSIRQKFNISEAAYVYGFLGRISKDKGNNELISAFRQMSEPNAVLLLMGPEEGSIDKELETWAKNSSKVVFAGRIDHDSIPAHLAALDVLVHPTYREGFGMVLQEAMAMEVPIITTDIPGPSEVIEDGISGVLVPSHDANALYKAMLDFYNNKEKYQQYGRNGRIRAEKCFDRPVMIENIYRDKEELYKRLTDSTNK